MKNTRRFISAVMALTMLSAIAPMSAFAADADRITIDQNSTEKKGTMTATYDVQAKYTVTIPAGVTLDSTNAVSKNIEASDVVLESGQKIKVTLTGASNTAEGSSFSAKNDKGDSTATYTISKGGTAVAVGDVVAEFTEDGTQALTFSKAEGATYAGTHTETLTFGIEVEDSVESVLAPVLENGAKINFAYNWNELNRNTYFEFTNNNGSYTLSSLTEQDAEHFNTTNLRVKADNPNVLILDVVCGEKYEWDDEFERMDPFCSTIEFDTTDNTFKFTNRGATPTNPPRKCKLISVSVNGTDVTDKLTDESTDKS